MIEHVAGVINQSKILDPIVCPDPVFVVKFVNGPAAIVQGIADAMRHDPYPINRYSNITLLGACACLFT